MKKILYICDYPYTLYSAIIKSCCEKNTCHYLLMTNSMNGMERLFEPLQKSGIFKEVYFYNDYLHRENVRKILPLASAGYSKNIIKKIFNLTRGTLLLLSSQRKAVKIQLPLDIKQGNYDEVFYTDRLSTLMFYLKAHNITYTAMEHSKNVWAFKKPSDLARIKFFYLLEKLHLAYGIGGYTKACSSVLVYDKNAVKETPPQATIKQWNIDECIQSMSVRHRDKIFQVYSEAYSLNIDFTKSYAVLLTNPLFADNYVASEDQQIALCKAVVKDYFSGDTPLIIKAHPRDYVNYQNVFPDAVIVDTSISAEILNFSQQLNIKGVLTFFSTSIHAFSLKTNNVISLYGENGTLPTPGHINLFDEYQSRSKSKET